MAEKIPGFSYLKSNQHFQKTLQNKTDSLIKKKTDMQYFKFIENPNQ